MRLSHLFVAAMLTVVAGSSAFSGGGGPVSASRSRALGLAKSLSGKPYVWGASGPDAFDCSGFVHYVISSEVGPQHYSAGEVKATTYRQILAKAGAAISASQALPGDIVFFSANVALGHPIPHIGIITDPAKSLFITAQDIKMGVALGSYGPHQYWASHSPEIFRNIWLK